MTTHRTYDVAVELSPQGEDEASAKRPPLLAAKIAPAAGGSYDLRLPADMYCFASGDAAYLVDTPRAPYRRCICSACRTFLSRLLPCRTPAHIAAEQVGEFCRMALPICATTPTSPRPPRSIPWHPSRALLWRSASTMGS